MRIAQLPYYINLKRDKRCVLDSNAAGMWIRYALIQDLTESMPDRLEAVRQAHGAWTKYLKFVKLKD